MQRGVYPGAGSRRGAGRVNATCAIGVDVGGTKCAAGAVRLSDGRVLARRRLATDPARGGHAVLASVIQTILELRDETISAGEKPGAVGVGIAELVDAEGRLASAATIDWRGLDACGEIHARTGMPTTVDADMRAAARAEAKWGAGRDFDSFVYVTVGTGISASLVVKGVPYVGARGLTGVFASSRGLIPNDLGELVGGPPLEQFASGPAIATRYAAIQCESCGTPDVVARAAAGDQAAEVVLASAGRALGAAIAQLISMLDPGAVVLGGGLGLVEGAYRASLTSALREYVWAEQHREIPLLSAGLGVDAGLIGAALAAAEQMEKGR